MTTKRHSFESGSKERKRVFLVDDHALVRNGIAEVINKSRGFRVCGEASTAEEALQGISSAGADIAIVDLSLGGSPGLDLVKDLTARYADLPVLILSMHDESYYAERALRAGAKGYIMKKEAIGELLSAIGQVLAGEVYLSPRMSRHLLQSIAAGGSTRSESPEARFSDRELEVYNLLGHGYGVSEIAGRLNLSPKTVETYQLRLKEKLGLKEAGDLVKFAIRWVASHGGPKEPPHRG